MDFPKNFIAATTESATLYQSIPSYYFRKKLELSRGVKKASLLICGLGFYRFWVNDKELTKGFLSPYITNPDNVLDYDVYDITGELFQGKNVLGFQLGNGMQNSFGGFVWDFDKASFRSAPKMACRLFIEYVDGSVEDIESDESFLVAPSPLLKDDLRLGEIYDANHEIKGWSEIDFDDSGWKNAMQAITPKGKAFICQAKPIEVVRELKPVAITFGEWLPGLSKVPHYGYIYDFGLNSSGLAKLKIKGNKGQKICLTFGEIIYDGRFYTDNISFIREQFANCPDFIQQDIYICKGEGIEEYVPSFTYHGFRYVFVEGITEEQATADLLTYRVMYTNLAECGNFSCSCEKLNKLQAMVRNATLSNFWHFPTDCPHREKNGWTGDVALSVEHTLLNLEAVDNYTEWMKHVRYSLTAEGIMSGVVPTGGWGYEWAGPAWDQAFVEIPYMVYRYTGDEKIIQDNIRAIIKYVRYLATKRDEKGLIEIGIGDWCAPKGVKAPEVFTSSVVSMTIFEKTAFMAKLCKLEEETKYCNSLAGEIKSCIRKELIDFESYRVVGDCQTSQAMAIYYDIFGKEEKKKAFPVLLSFIEQENNHLDTGVLGARVIFHVLAEFGYADLAYKIMVNPISPSYGAWVEAGFTAAAETLFPEDKNSKNHHFWGDISAFFIKQICGIHYNPNMDDLFYVEIRPQFISFLENARAYHKTQIGEIFVQWERKEDCISLEICIPKGMKYAIKQPKDYEVLENVEAQGRVRIKLCEAARFKK